jgi:hypothetical protein
VAKIASGQDKALVACRVVDISESGARIHLARDQELPQIFTLVLTHGRGPRRFCQVLRREGTTLERDDFGLNHDPALAFCLSMIFSENRYPLFRIMH